ncbi:MAG: demethoxyubiquinone hydroxylase family protein [Pseudomonadota bacterium]
MTGLETLELARRSAEEIAEDDLQVLGDLRTDHAGETGAVFIYKGILAVSRHEPIRRFAEEHLETEKKHLAAIEIVLPSQHRSRLLVCWRAAGWLIGAVPAFFGPKTVYRTIDAVETFVDRHYQEQIDLLETKRDYPALLALLKSCQADELHHRDEARGLAIEIERARPNMITRLWLQIVSAGSEAAVKIARAI